MTKKMNLVEALQKESTALPKTKAAAVPSKKTVTAYNLPPSRRGKKALTVYLDPDVIKQVKFIGIDQEMSTQDIVRDALNDYFAKHGKAQIA